MMSQDDLVSLSDVKSWLGVTTSDETRDAALSRLITRVSRAVYNVLNRSSLLPSLISETYDGSGKSRLQLRNWPVVSISHLAIAGQPVPASSSIGDIGYVLEAPDQEPPGHHQIITLRGLVFPRGESNVQVDYVCGYMTTDALIPIPSSPHTIHALAPYGDWRSDQGVRFSDGGELSMVTGALLSGQYSVQDGVYTFAADDTGRLVTMSYGYIPADIAGAALEWIAYRWSAKDHIGQTSKSIGGQETVSYTNEAVPTFVAQMLQNSRRVTPC